LTVKKYSQNDTLARLQTDGARGHSFLFLSSLFVAQRRPCRPCWSRWARAPRSRRCRYVGVSPTRPRFKRLANTGSKLQPPARASITIWVSTCSCTCELCWVISAMFSKGGCTDHGCACPSRGADLDDVQACRRRLRLVRHLFLGYVRHVKHDVAVLQQVVGIDPIGANGPNRTDRLIGRPPRRPPN